MRRVVLTALLVLGAAAAAAYFVTRTTARQRTATTPRILVTPRPIPGFLLIADRGNNRILLVDDHKRIIWRYPASLRETIFPLRFDDDAFFGPGLRTIISNQEEQQTIQVISFPQGKLRWVYGHVNVKNWVPGYLNTPDDAYLLRDGLISVADAYNCRVLFINRAHRIVRNLGTAHSCVHDPPRSLGPVNGATPMPGGGTLVSEINGSWVDDFAKNGRLLWSFRAPVAYPSDPQWLGHGRILLADYHRPGHVLILNTKGHVLWRYGPRSGPGALDHPSLALPITPTLIAVNDDYRDRVVVISIPRRKIVWQYGHTDVKGRTPGYLNTPDGLDLLPFRRALAIPALRALVQRAERP